MHITIWIHKIITEERNMVFIIMCWTQCIRADIYGRHLLIVVSDAIWRHMYYKTEQ